MPIDTKSEVLARALHDLQAPARHVKLFSELLRESLDTVELTDSTNDYLSAIERAGDQLHEIIDSLRAFLKLPSEMGAAQEIELAELVQRCWNKVEEGSQGRSLLRISGDATIRSDRKLLAQIVTEAFRNADRFRRPGEALEVQCEISRQDADCCIEIADNGVGIEIEFLDRVLEPFERLPTAEVRCGTGLGLPMCREAIRLLGGTLTLDSDGHSGATVTLNLPCEP